MPSKSWLLRSVLSVHARTSNDNRVGTNAATRGQPTADQVMAFAHYCDQGVRVLETWIKGSELLNFDDTCVVVMQCFDGRNTT